MLQPKIPRKFNKIPILALLDKPRKVLIWLRNTELEQVHEFYYLESLLTEDARCNKEIKKRITMAKAAFMRRGELLRGNISKDLKKRKVKALVWSVALYGSEMWTLRKEDILSLIHI